MASTDAREIPVDFQSAERLAANGLVYRTIDTGTPADADAFTRADARGFLDAQPSDEMLVCAAEVNKARRNVGVFEPDVPVGTLPVATLNSWITPMTIPGGEIDMWAISAVTVSGTHRRRGIARALLEGELRAAASAGISLAGLTVSEATIYARYGFASALPVASVTVDTQRAGWLGGTAPGRIEYIEPVVIAEELAAMHDRERTQRAGQIPGWPGRWQRMAGLEPDDKARASVRGVRYLDTNGVTQGVMAYSLAEIPGTFRSTLSIRHLGAATDEALRALWGFAVQHDLVLKVTADQRPVDDPITWLVADQRAVTFTVHDHGWLRVLDVPGCFSARTYRAPLDVVLQVDDPLGFTAGSWRLTVGADGHAGVESVHGVESRPSADADLTLDAVADVTLDADADVTLDAVALAALYAGGVSATRLLAAGRIATTPEVAASIDDAFRTERAPALGIWY